MTYLYCQADGCGSYVDDMSCHCGWKQPEEYECPEGQDYFPVTGLLFGNEGVVDLFTDSDEDYADE